ncbi:MAG: gamma-glutamyltransferase [Alphaproteobacteria bacterium]|jgi:gamma-glutamyltranspeptidase/glutathione hydrolase|nr:gamma-glutamyltransferase [Alphaproteobacteria bacterium]
MAQDPAAIYSGRDRFHPVLAETGMVAAQEATATGVGLDILREGGNAVDAAVAVGFALAVTLPRAGNLGGGGFMMVHDAETGETVALDYREVSGAAATRDMYLDEEGNADPQLSRFSALATGVPGTVAGLALAHERYGSGRFTLAELIEPARRLAAEGIEVTPDLASSLARARDRLGPHPSSAAVFYREDGSLYAPGNVLVQADLAESLRLIAEQGPAAVYDGPIGEAIVATLQEGGGILTMEDFRTYQPVVREPVRGHYRGHEIVSMPPPSSGGVHIVQILNILEGVPLGFLGHNSADSIHWMAEAMKLAYADRSRYLGDPDFVAVPVAGLTAPDYAAELRTQIDPHRARPASEIGPGNPLPYESDETTHFSIVDGEGNAVANTYTLNFSYGSGLMAEGTGILLNNELDDFSAKPGVPNAYGLIGGEANAVEPGKRPLSSMSPTLVFRDGALLLVTGSPGGSRIITTTLQLIMNVVDHGMNVAEATAAPRIHHQWLPDEMRVEAGLSPDTIRLLSARGHDVVVRDAMGSTQSILVRPDGVLTGASDPRRPGALTDGY